MYRQVLKTLTTHTRGYCRHCATHLITEETLVECVGAHAQGVFECQVAGKRGEALPERPHALLVDYLATTVNDTAVLSSTVELDACFDDIDGLQAGRFSNTTQGACVSEDMGMGCSHSSSLRDGSVPYLQRP